MRRYFISQHPTFGSYANPIASKIEKSPYFYWWLALTLNDEYVAFCETVSNKQNNQTDEQMFNVYKDFGDVRYEGDVHKAFTDWWLTKVSETECRGVYLLAEPFTDNRVQLIDTFEDAEASVNDESSILIRIPKVMSRKFIDASIERIFAKELSFEKGRQVRNPSRSNARYSLSKVCKAEALKEEFSVYRERLAQQSEGKVDNTKIAKKLGISVDMAEDKIDAEDKHHNFAAYKRQVISTKITRKFSNAKKSIANTAKGMFP